MYIYIYIYIQLGIVIFLIAFNFSENDGTIIGLLEVDIISSFIYIYFVRLCSAFYFYLFSPCDSGTWKWNGDGSKRFDIYNVKYYNMVRKFNLTYLHFILFLCIITLKSKVLISTGAKWLSISIPVKPYWVWYFTQIE